MNIAVTGLNATDNPGPGVPVIRSLKELKDQEYKITGLLYDSLEPGLYMDNIADSYYLIPYPSTGLESLFERICYIHDKEKLDLIIPSLDSELYAFDRLKPKLDSLGIKTFIPDSNQLNLRAKDKLVKFCTDHNIRVPKNILVNSLNDINSVSSELKYPAAVKGIFYDAYIVHNFNEAVTAFEKISSKWGYPVIIQEFVKGNEFNVAALGDGKGNTIGAVPMRKLYITDKGKGWSGVTIEDKTLLETAHYIIDRMKWKGGMELEFIKDEKSNQYYLLEINPRFPAWIYLATSAGQNLPAALLKLASGNNVDPFTSYETGKIFVRCSWDIITDLKKFEMISVYGEYKSE